MAEIFRNPLRGPGLPDLEPHDAFDTDAVARLLEQCPAHAVTPLRQSAATAAEIGAARVFLKDESTRMGLGSFKALGAAYVIARDAARVVRKTGAPGPVTSKA